MAIGDIAPEPELWCDDRIIPLEYENVPCLDTCDFGIAGLDRPDLSNFIDGLPCDVSQLGMAMAKACSTTKYAVPAREIAAKLSPTLWAIQRRRVARAALARTNPRADALAHIDVISESCLLAL